MARYRARLGSEKASEAITQAGIPCDPRTLLHWEAADSSPKAWQVPIIAAVYNVSPGYFFRPIQKAPEQ